ncbi:hypothetical protein FT663_02807 [Candidozyma haemuli var. vulneris]|uniref:Uncharacterized protein n=1 Tax=Candidozyma haemuli TaxID=45357 RepID=A0A2V1AX44_9ASCO|nr:hypothetical protein CXQ85_005221 [[Candida] haemuloni]KAF3991306.1 hypothetical protein FT663_02807 [[Candida] haemuloni var. vulneris]KAF3991992.1 hypothetical protein FT662_01445 [[Candida] haemuloni var. vulneris]PVH22647.1 hypothetical protein CXQ85_005221 [[Candida] haemuloni]
MFAKSATPATPVTRPKSHINDSVTWVKEWYNPLEYGSGGPANLKLKGWVKTNASAAEDAAPNVDSTSVYNLESCQYLQDPVIVEVVQEAPPDPQQDSDLRSALSMDKKDDQISSLSGLGM